MSAWRRWPVSRLTSAVRATSGPHRDVWGVLLAKAGGRLGFFLADFYAQTYLTFGRGRIFSPNSNTLLIRLSRPGSTLPIVDRRERSKPDSKEQVEERSRRDKRAFGLNANEEGK
jgi:hypothetical protein